MLKNLRVKLTLLYLSVAILLVFLLGSTTYGVLYYYFQNSTDLALRTKMATVYTSLGVALPAALSQAEREWSEQATHSLIPFVIEENKSKKEEEYDTSNIPSIKYEGELSSIFVLPLDSKGSLIFNPNPYKPPMLPDQNALNNSLANNSDLRTVSLADGTSIRLLTYHLSDQPGIEILQLGKPIEDQLKILNQFLEGLLIIGSAGILVLGVGSWWLAGKMLASAQKAWDNQQLFIANASHELRAPLTLIRAGSDAALRKSTVNSSTRNLLQDVVSEVDHMNHLVEDLLLLSRLDIGQLKMKNEDVRLNELADEIQRQFQPVSEEKSVVFSVQADEVKIRGDMIRLRQVILILLDNALRHTPGGGNIQLAIRNQDNHAVISVSDSGEGIPQKHQAHVFERFYQVESDRREGNSGSSGLGLSIAKSIVENQGGKISIQSEIGKGTMVNCVFPVSVNPTRKKESIKS
jgi:signal transduction histidine kinase